ncbi:MAG: hypothetical protein ACRDGL_05870, partial [Candidatus Limnocylindrales bacterium]
MGATLTDAPSEPLARLDPAPVEESFRERRRRSGPELMLVVMELSALLGFHRVYRGGGWLLPVMGTAVAVHLVCRATR